MNSEPTAINWQTACGLLTEAGHDRGVHQFFPDSSCQLSLLAAIKLADVASSSANHAAGQVLSERLKSLVTQAQSLNRIGKCPVVGITGLLNSGKSSLLASYLSPAGRARVLRGTANNQGTHRFVLWLPDVWWRDSDLLQLLQQYIVDLFGTEPEMLSDDVDQAFAQYNGQLAGSTSADPLSMPLIAHDPGLDGLGLAMLDCPDIQSAFGFMPQGGVSSGSHASPDAEQSQHQRRQMLGRIGRLCSAFLVVTRFNNLHEETLTCILETLRDTMPGVRRILCVNKVKARYTPDDVDQQAQELVEKYKIANVYMAYDFRSHWAKHRLPPIPPAMHWNADDPLPLFFRAAHSLAAASRAMMSSDAESQSANGMRPPVVEAYLQDLSHVLNPGALVAEGRRSVLEQLQQKSTAAVHWFEANQAERQRQLHDTWQVIAQACYAFMGQRDANDQTISLRLQTSPAIVAQMSDSLVRTANWWMWPSMKLDRSMRQLQSSIAGELRKVRWLQNASTSLSKFVNRFRHGETGKIVTADRFRSQLESSDRYGVLAHWPTDSLTQACEQALARFQKEDTARLDEAWLDEWSKAVWEHMPLKNKVYVGVMPLAPIFGPLLAVTLIPFDGGGTAVLVFATTKELLLAAGISTLLTPIAGGEVQDIVERETAMSQLSELFAIACDSLGVPRPPNDRMPKLKLAGVERVLTTSQLATKAAATSVTVPQWSLAPNYASQLRQSLDVLRATDAEGSNPS